MTLYEFFTVVGGDYDAVRRRLPSEDMIRRFLAKFPADPSYHDLQAALCAGDLSAAFRAAHTLKGVAATLELGALFRASSALTEALRNAAAAPDSVLVRAADEAYRQTCEAISLLAV